MREIEEVGALVESMVAKVARRHGLSHAALNALAVIEGAGGPIPTGELGARMHITTGSTTSILDTLERSGYVRRLADPDDRRRVMVDITDEAQAVLDRVLPEVTQVSTVAARALDDGVLEQLLATLAALRAGVADIPDTLPAPAARRPPARLRR